MLVYIDIMDHCLSIKIYIITYIEHIWISLHYNNHSIHVPIATKKPNWDFMRFQFGAL